MKQSAIIILLFVCSYSSVVSQEKWSAEDSLSYAAGLMMMEEMKKIGFKELNPEMVSRAIADQNADKLTMTLSEANGFISARKNKMAEILNMENKVAGEAFLESNKGKEGVHVMDNGIQYEIINSGEGASPTLNDEVNTHYHGMLIDGTVFDSSVDRGQPISFPLRNVIVGWQEVLQEMKVGINGGHISLRNLLMAHNQLDLISSLTQH